MAPPTPSSSAPGFFNNLDRTERRGRFLLLLTAALCIAGGLAVASTSFKMVSPLHFLTWLLFRPHDESFYNETFQRTAAAAPWLGLAIQAALFTAAVKGAARARVCLALIYSLAAFLSFSEVLGYSAYSPDTLSIAGVYFIFLVLYLTSSILLFKSKSVHEYQYAKSSKRKG